MKYRPLIFAPLALAACTGTAPVAGIPGCHVGPCIATGESQTFGDMTVTPLEVLADSRCPIEAECIWAGELIVRTRLDIGHETITADITAWKPFIINGGTLTLVEVAPDASVERPELKQADYNFRFKFVPAIMDQARDAS